jgi:outer membrane protein insertion porin family
MVARLMVLSLAGVIALATPAAAKPAAARPAAAPAHAAQSRIAGVRIEGNARVDEEAIRIHIQSRVGQALDRTTVDSDVRAIYAMGFFENVEVDRLEESDGTVLVFRVHERPQITSVTIEGTKKLRSEDVEAALKIRPHTILDAEKMLKGIADAKKLYEEKGYLDATITPKTEPVPGAANEIALTYVVAEGKIVRIQTIEIEGNTAFSDRKLKRVMTTSEENLISRFTGAGPQRRGPQDRHRAPDRLLLRQRLHHGARRRAQSRTTRRRPLRHHQDRRGRSVHRRYDRLHR